MTWLLVVTFLGASFVLASFTLSQTYKNKAEDSWTIIFLEVERFGRLISDTLAAESGRLATAAGPPSLVFERGGSEGVKAIVGDLPAKDALEALGVSSLTLEKPVSVLTVAGKSYLAKSVVTDVGVGVGGLTLGAGTYLMLWPFDFGAWVQRLSEQRGLDSVVYVATEQGRLLYASDPDITPGTYAGRALVQKFIANPLTQGQMELAQGAHGAFGFFYEVPRTNLVLFTESSKESIEASFHALIWRVVGVILVVLLVAVFILSAALRSIVEPLHDLLKHASNIKSGNFKLQLRHRSIGEIAKLSHMFVGMARSLQDREEEVAKLMETQKRVFHFEREMAVAQNIQENLLPRVALPAAARVNLTSMYRPAGEVAGDWFNYFYDPNLEETVFAIADVSGHGTGASIYTAIIAGLFEDFRGSSQKAGATFPTQDFLEHLNGVLFRLGRGEWHATVTVAKVRTRQNELILVNAGHPAPFVLTGSGETAVCRRPSLPSNFIGTETEFKTRELILPLQPDLTIVFFTDGLLEAKAASGRAFGAKRVSQAISRDANPGVAAVSDRIYNDWLVFIGNTPPDDDVCLVAMRAA